MDIFVDNDNIARLRGLKTHDETYINNSTVILTISEIDTNKVLYDYYMSVDSGSANYYAEIPHTIDIEKKRYSVTLKTYFGGRRGFWKGQLKGVARGFEC